MSNKRGEKPIEDNDDRFVGKTIKSIDASTCNNVVFFFADGTATALHIDCDSMGLPDVLTCVDCVSESPTPTGEPA
jgi:hypothetical protein